jgi:formate hydrogenlyase subunit 4
MTILAAVLIQLLHAMLLAAAAFGVACMLPWMTARLAGRAAPPILGPWRDMVRTMRKQPMVAENVSVVFRVGPAFALAATVTAALLVPSFALGMASAPIADLLTIGGLLGSGRMALLLAAMDSGSARGGIVAAHGALVSVLATPALLLATLALALLAGGTSLDSIAGLQLDGMLPASGGSIFAAAALLPIAKVEVDVCSAEREFGGRDLTLVRLEATMRLVCWFNVLFALFLPFGMAPAEDGLGPWGTGLAWGLLCWLGKFGAMSIGFAGLSAMTGGVRRTVAIEMLGIAGVLALLAAAIVLSATGPA